MHLASAIEMVATESTARGTMGRAMDSATTLATIGARW
jgi:hypothetical protein